MKIIAKILWVVNIITYIYYVIKNKQIMKVQLNIVPFITAIASGFVAINILNGNAVEYVYFAGPDNELGCAVIALTMASLSLFASFEKINAK